LVYFITVYIFAYNLSSRAKTALCKIGERRQGRDIKEAAELVRRKRQIVAEAVRRAKR
jgi:hypothetical protein